MSTPFREQQLEPEEVRRILRRAAELAGRDAASAAEARALTLAELERHAGELGLSADVVRRAADERDAPAEATGAPHVSFWTGTRVPLVLEETLYGTPSDKLVAELGETIEWVMGAGKLKRDGGHLIWQPEAPPGTMPRALTVGVLAQRGCVRIRIEERLGPLAGGLIGGVGIGAGLPVGVTALVLLSVLANMVPLALALGLGFPAALVLIMRSVVRLVARSREAQLTALMARLRETVEAGLEAEVSGGSGASSSAAGVRVAVAERAAPQERRDDELSYAAESAARRRER